MSLEDDVKHILDGLVEPPRADSWGGPMGPDSDTLDEEQWRPMVLGRLDRLHAAILRLARDLDTPST
jgi:hypothetical protein